MRRMLRIFGWMGLGLSTILFVGTGVLWVRSIGQWEGWTFTRFEPHPEWTTRPRGWGTWRGWRIMSLHGHLRLDSWTYAPFSTVTSSAKYDRVKISADEAKDWFKSRFEPGERPWLDDGTERAWHFAGLGFHHARSAVASETGQTHAKCCDLAIPLWMFALLFGAWPLTFAGRRLLRKRRFAAGLCPHCGYDLRATPDRCPECGTKTA